jgi:hypothetical protein
VKRALQEKLISEHVNADGALVRAKAREQDSSLDD